MKFNRVKFSPLQILVHASALILAAWLVWDYTSGNLTVNPYQAATQRTGRYAITFLVLSLACTPANTLFGFRQALTARRPLGLYAFLFAISHFLIFFGLDYGFDLALIKDELLDKRYVLVGLATLSILTPLAITSFKWWMKRMGKNWKRLHRLVYLAGALAVLHYAWAVKGDLLTLQGDVLKPLAYGFAVALLLVARIPAVRRSASRMRQRLAQSVSSPTPAFKDLIKPE